MQLEREFAVLISKVRNMERHEKSEPLLDEFFAWPDSIFVSVGSTLARVVSYARSEKKYLLRFLESPDVPIDNNRPKTYSTLLRLAACDIRERERSRRNDVQFSRNCLCQ